VCGVEVGVMVFFSRGGAVDKSLRLPAYWADCEVTLGKDVAKAREVWEALLKNKSYASLPVRRFSPEGPRMQAQPLI